MEKICVIIEGQLRGSENCGPTIQKYVVEHLNADLYFYVQNYELHDDSFFEYYGAYKEKIIYDNPSPDFEQVFNSIASNKNIEKEKWKTNFNYFIDNNYKLGYDNKKPGTCIRRMYNRHLIYEKFKDYDYDWYIILRSDMYFYEKFHDIITFSKDSLHVSNFGNWNGINNNLIVFNKQIMKNVLNYLELFLNGSLITFSTKNKINKTLNEERFFKLACYASNVKIKHMKTTFCFISGNKNQKFTTWSNLYSYFDYVYKYEYDFKQFLEYTNQLDSFRKAKNNKNNKNKI